MVLGDRICGCFFISRLLLLLEESELVVEALLDADILRREADEHFRRFKSNSGLPRIKD